MAYVTIAVVANMLRVVSRKFVLYFESTSLKVFSGLWCNTSSWRLLPNARSRDRRNVVSSSQLETSMPEAIPPASILRTKPMAIQKTSIISIFWR